MDPLTSPEDRWYIEQEGGVVVEATHADWMRFRDSRLGVVGQTSRGGVTISTVFLGCNEGTAEEPLFYETLITGGPLDGRGDQYATRRDAGAGHRLWCRMANDAEHSPGARSPSDRG